MAFINDNNAGNSLLGEPAKPDLILGNGGDDIINTLTCTPGDGGDRANGGTGFDTLVVNASAERLGVSLSAQLDPNLFVVRSAEGRFFIDADEFERVNFTGGNGDDGIDTGIANAAIDGNGGIDHWRADLSAATVDIRYNLATSRDIRDAGINLVRDIERLTLTTGSGNDVITGGVFSDWINTGAGNDVVNLRSQLETEGQDLADLGAGIDTLIVNASAETTAVRIAPSIPGNTTFFGLSSASGNFVAAASNVERVIFAGGSGDDFIDTGIRGVGVNGGGGIDHWLADLSGRGANVFFNLGTTRAIPSAGLRSILGIEQISLTTGSGNDVVTGGVFSDTINTGKGNDTVNLRSQLESEGQDRADLGAGIDTLIVNAASETRAVRIAPSIPGNTTFFGLSSDSGNFVAAASNVERVIFTGGSGDDFIDTGIRGVGVNGGGGIDHWLADLSGRGANVFFNLGTTREIPSAGLRSILGVEQISLTTGSGNDVVSGGAQADTIRTGAGNDTVNARTHVPSEGFDLVDGGAGFDTLVVDATGETAHVSAAANDFVNPTNFGVSSTDGRFNVGATNIERAVFTGGNGNDFFKGSTGADRLTGNAGDDTLSGGINADTLIGSAGADTFDYDSIADSRPGRGVDRIVGFNAADTLDLIGVDANSRAAGNQAFTFIFGQAFRGVAGELRIGQGVIEGDVNGDAVRDFLIFVTGIGGADILL